MSEGIDLNCVSIRKITDLLELIKIKDIVFRAYEEKFFVYDKNESLESIQTQFLNGVNVYLIEETSTNMPIGTFRLKIDDKEGAFVFTFAILPEFRSLHLVLFTWKFFIAECRRMNLATVKTSTFRYHRRLIDLYKKLGFEFLKFEEIPGSFYERIILEYKINKNH